MARTGRKKSKEAMYHIMSRSISELDLFRCDEDKSYYLKLLKRYTDENHCRIYAYILMSNHVHFYVNPCGYDISKFMLSLNTAYVIYYNKKYNRHGHLFQGRFASTIVNNDSYSLTLSAYIHNNAKDLPGYAEREEFYRYSSYGVYVGIRQDLEGILDTQFLLKLFSGEKKLAHPKYHAFTKAMKETKLLKEVDDNILRAYTENTYSSGKSYIVRIDDPDELIQKIKELLGEKLPEGLRSKHSREAGNIRSFIIYTMRVLCGYSYKMLCKYIGNMSVSGISCLSNRGFRLLSDQKYRKAFNVLAQVG